MLIMLLYIMLCSRCSFSTAVGCWAVAFVTAELMASVEWQVSSALLASRSMKNAGVILVMLCVFGVMLLGVYVGEKKIYDGPVRMEPMQSVLLWILALLAMVISNVGFQKMVWRGQADLQTTLSSIRSLVDFGALASMYLIQRVYWEHAMQLEMASVNYMLNLQYQQYRDYKMNSEYISRQCHDLKYQIEALRRACTEDEREQYLAEMETAIRNYNAQNVTNTMEMGWVEEYEPIKGVLLCPGAGSTGFAALGQIAAGEVNPSGRTCDTWVYDFTKTPYYQNIGDFTYNNIDDYIRQIMEADETLYPGAFVDYVENIYVGYKFYETAAEEGLIDFEKTVKYPFGYGLSYTEFKQEMGEISRDESGIL